MFITFEGLDCSGKSTQAQLLVEKLTAAGLPGADRQSPVRLIREPGGTAISERLREILLDRATLDLHERAELFLFEASRAQLVHQVIRPALARGDIVVCDRYDDSSTAYQGHGRGLDRAAVQQINHFATGGLVPDLTFFIDITPGEILRRKLQRGDPADRMESAGGGFYERVREGYLSIGREEPGRFAVIDGMASIPAVEDAVWRTLVQRTEHLRMQGRHS